MARKPKKKQVEFEEAELSKKEELSKHEELSKDAEPSMTPLEASEMTISTHFPRIPRQEFKELVDLLVRLEWRSPTRFPMEIIIKYIASRFTGFNDRLFPTTDRQARCDARKHLQECGEDMSKRYRAVMTTVRPKIRQILVSWLAEEKTDFQDLWIHTDLVDYGRTATMMVNARMISRIFPRLGEEALTVARFFHEPRLVSPKSATQAVVEFAKEEHTTFFNGEDEYAAITAQPQLALRLRNAGLDKDRYITAGVWGQWRKALESWLPADIGDEALEHCCDRYLHDYGLTNEQFGLVWQIRSVCEAADDEAKKRMDSAVSTFAAAEGLSLLKAG